MLKLSLICLSLTAALLLSTAAQSDNTAANLYQKQCTRCHGTEIYAVAKRQITSFAALERQVERCALVLGLPWSEYEVHTISIYLNQQFYRFPR
jgi:hypothetical protein